MLTFLMSISFILGIFVASLLWQREMTTLGFSRAPKRDPHQKYPFVKASSLLNELETAVMDILQRDMDRNRIVMCKVQLTAIATIPPRTERAEFLKKLAGTRHLDFVIFDATNYKPLLAIQMPGNEDDIQIITDAMQTIKMPLVVLPNKKSYSIIELHDLILQATSTN